MGEPNTKSVIKARLAEVVRSAYQHLSPNDARDLLNDVLIFADFLEAEITAPFASEQVRSQLDQEPSNDAQFGQADRSVREEDKETDIRNYVILEYVARKSGGATSKANIHKLLKLCGVEISEAYVTTLLGKWNGGADAAEGSVNKTALMTFAPRTDFRTLTEPGNERLKSLRNSLSLSAQSRLNQTIANFSRND